MDDVSDPMVVEQFIPNVLMTPLDNFLLTRIFQIAQYEDGVEFFAKQWPGELLFLFDDEPDELLEAIEKTKDIDPELCADVKRAMQTDGTDGDTVVVNLYNFGSYCPVFQGIIRRSGGKLPYVTTQGAFTSSIIRRSGGKLPYVTTQGAFTSYKNDQLGGMAEVITADAIEHVSTFTWARDWSNSDLSRQNELDQQPSWRKATRCISQGCYFSRNSEAA
jgi:hypothetical protein